jgi:aryl-phospho-beta-D-glucosidase BglC (GH1 family)
MKKFLNKAKETFNEHQSSSQSNNQQPISQAPQPSSIGPPTATDLLRYRYHNGTNLGSIFVLEKWLHGSMFPKGCTGGSELNAVSAQLKETGLDATRQKFENHWRNALTDQDLEWLVRDAKCTSIRLPIGYFTLGPSFCHDTPFEKVGDVYVNAWNAVKELVAKARGYGIGVLLDMHALPGGANKDAHSGSGNGKADLWESKKNKELGKKALVTIAQEVAQGGQLEGVIGIQLVNEAAWAAKGMYEWYDDVINEISRIDGTIPIYISDAWNLNKTLEWTNKRHCLKGAPSNPVVIDTHKYYTFDEKHKSKAPQEIIGLVGQACGPLDGKAGALADKGEAQIVIGEWSCVLDGQTWGKCRPEDKDGLVQQFGQAQSKKWQEKAGGSFFWTYKMDWMDGGEWGFAQQVKKGNITPPYSLTLPAQEVRNRTQHAQSQRQGMADGARKSHDDYWTKTSPGKKFEHHLFSEGWDTGFSDAQRFFSMRVDGALGQKAGEGGDKIGCLEIWVKKRMLESGNRSDFLWEWEQGFRSGVAAFYHCVGV